MCHFRQKPVYINPLGVVCLLILFGLNRYLPVFLGALYSFWHQVACMGFYHADVFCLTFKTPDGNLPPTHLSLSKFTAKSTQPT